MKKVRLHILIVFLSLLSLIACQTSQTSIQKVASLNVSTAYSVFVQDDFAFVANNDGVVIIDIHQRNKPKKASLIELSEAAFGVYVQNDLLFIAAPSDGLIIVDIQDKNSPKILFTIEGSAVNDICVEDKIAYAGTQQGKLLIINIEDPTNPALLGIYTNQGRRSLMVACHKNVVYFSSSEEGLDVIDVSNPSLPIKIMTVSGTQGAKDAQIFDDVMALACHGNGVRILDISDIHNPKTVSSFNNGGEAWGTGGDSNFLWVGDLKEGIEFYDISNLQSPVLIAQDHRYAPHDVFYDGQYTYLADQDSGFVILEYTDDSQE